MLTNKKRLLATALVILMTANISIANDAVISDVINAKEGSLKLVMQGLLKDTQALTSAMLNEDFALVAVQANNIADHPKPSMAIRKKLMKAMGADMVKFKANDDVVHNAAVAIMKNAEQKNIKGVNENFNKMIGGCLSCHRLFKNKVSAIFKRT